MKSRFSENVVAIILTCVAIVFFWFLNGKPMSFSNEELMIFDTAVIALYFSIRNDLLRKED